MYEYKLFIQCFCQSVTEGVGSLAEFNSKSILSKKRDEDTYREHR